MTSLDGKNQFSMEHGHAFAKTRPKPGKSKPSISITLGRAFIRLPTYLPTCLVSQFMMKVRWFDVNSFPRLNINSSCCREWFSAHKLLFGVINDDHATDDASTQTLLNWTSEFSMCKHSLKPTSRRGSSFFANFWRSRRRQFLVELFVQKVTH